jgi:Tfp pilus assembly protein PilO
METKKREKLLMVGAGAIVLLYIANVAIISPLGTVWAEKSQKITELHEKLEQGNKLIGYGDVVNRQWDKMRTNSLPSNLSLAEAQMLKSFDRWERTAGITRVSIKPQLRTSDEDYATLEFRVDYTADMDKVNRFLYEVEKDPLGIKIEELELATRDDRGSQVSLALQLSGLVMHPETSGDKP